MTYRYCPGEGEGCSVTISTVKSISLGNGEVVCDAGRTGTDMSGDLPPPYEAVAELKTSQLTQQQQLPGPANYSAGGHQTLPPHPLPAYPSAPPGYEAVAYYPPLNAADAAVLLQPPPPTQIITIVQTAQPDVQEAERNRSCTTTDVCLFRCMCLCCCCPCVLVSFM